ncbi:MAG: [Fe-Fe] hydrogenase large subunit C-terminal domain-containing protein [Eubacterium sp.]
MNVINFTKANCKNCYKCIRHCPVKAIRLVDNQAEIVEDLCIGCGNCFKNCPQNAKKIINNVEEIKQWIKNDQVVLSLAPSFPAAFRLKNPLQILGGLRSLGFSVIEETAIGAEYVSQIYERDYYSDQKYVITTSCPTINMMVEKYYSNAVQYLSTAVSPMVAHGKILKEKYPDAHIIFAGPCISKKIEAEDFKDIIDGVLTFDELDMWFRESGIDLAYSPIDEFDSKSCDVARFYPLAGGIAKSSVETVSGDRKILKIDGLVNCQDFLNHLGYLDGRYWVEMNTCVEGCINGPGNTHSELVKYEKIERVENYIKNTQRKKMDKIKIQTGMQRSFIAQEKNMFGEVPQEAIEEILRQTGKFSTKDELNCGTCGYDSCREKAAAVYCGMAELDMCLPFMRNRNEAISNLIISSTPNAIAVLDKDYRVLDFNTAAEKLFKKAKDDILNQNFVEVFDYNPFKKLKNIEGNSYTGRGLYSGGNIHFMEILTYIPGQEMYMGIFIDISRDIKKEKAYRKMQVETLEMAQKVIDKQMRVAHEIAELLGETTAETKVTLTRLQKIVGTGEEE